MGHATVEDLLAKAGLGIRGGGEGPIALTFDSLDEAWDAHRPAGPPQKVIDAVGATACVR